VLRAGRGRFVAAFSAQGFKEECVWEEAWNDLRGEPDPPGARTTTRAARGD
jgi:hypothetical protein